MKKTIVVNLLGAAGSGKSTLAAEVFSRLKRKGINCEYVDEYAKHMVYESNYERLKNQLLVLSNQYFALDVLRGKVDVIVTDSPILLSLFYNKNNVNKDHLKVPEDIFQDLVLHCYSTFDNLNYFIVRNHEYKKEGRYQEEDEARVQEGILKDMLSGMEVDFREMLSTDNCADVIVDDVVQRCKYYDNMLKAGMEIERKFLLKHMPANLSDKQTIIQAYFVKNNHEIRVRAVDGKKFYMTEKYGSGVQREEFEKEISKAEFVEGFRNSKGKIIAKNRYKVPLADGLTAEIDVYSGKHKGLKVVEVEFPSVESADGFVPPAWFGVEVTHLDSYKNFNLSVAAQEKDKGQG